MPFRRHLAALFFAAAPALLAQTPAPAPAPAPAPPASLVIFSDFQCPFSADEFFVIQRLQQRLGPGLAILYKNAPLPIHPDSPLAHRAAIAAAHQGKLQPFAELLFANQAHQSRAQFIGYATRLHLDVPRFTRDLDSPATAAELASDLTEARALGIDSTPTLFLNGHRLDGVQSSETLAALLTPNAAATPATPDNSIPTGLSAQLLADPTATRGDDHAPVTLVEFTDFQCPFCQAAVEPLRQLLATRGRDVRLVFRAFPLDFHPDAQLAAEAALAAGAQGKFWPMHDLLFANQHNLKLTDLQLYASQLGLNLTAFNEALTTHRYAAQVAADRALGQRAGVNGTPTFILDNQLLTGVRSLPELTAWVDAQKPATRNPATRNPDLTQLAVTPAPATLAEHTVSSPATPAPVTLTWFTDVRSPLAASQASLVRAVLAHANGRVRLLYKPFPLESYPDARLGSAALLAALAQQSFWPMYDAIAARRDTLDPPKLLTLAASLHLDPAAFARDLDRADTELGPALEEASRRGIQGAPVIFLNAQRVDGLQRENFYLDILDTELRNATPATTTAALR